MRQEYGTRATQGAKVVKDIRRATRKQYSDEDKNRIVLDGLKGAIGAVICGRLLFCKG